MTHLFHAGPVQAAFDPAGHLLHLGPALPDGAPDYRPAISHARIDLPSWPSALPQAADGWFGTPGISVVGAFPNAQVQVDQAIRYRDEVAGLAFSQHWQGLADGVFEVHSQAQGQGELSFLASVTLPLTHCQRVGYLRGGWTREGQWMCQPLTAAGLHQQSRTGRSSAEGYPGVYLYFPDQVVIVALAWSGDFEWHCDVDTTGRAHFTIGERLQTPLSLTAGHRTPSALVAVGADEFEARARLHQAVRSNWLPQHGPRGVHLNSWEAVYFDHDMAGLQRLIDAGVQAGAQRFVLDDGWFGARRDDTRGLGDWTVSNEVWPEGFRPLVQALDAAGMEFGLWVEPEMVNPDSDLYRSHPEWVLAAEGYAPTTGRGQLQLNLGLEAVIDYLFDQLDALLQRYPIRYFKWDHNRLAHQADTRASVLGVYRLFERLRAAHPALEIESCASGGGRTDFGVLRHCYRVWGSDCNDPLDRARTHAGWFRFMPPEVVGSHVGPAQAHTTSRQTALATRVIVALQGSYGYEYDLSQSPEDIECVAHGAAWWRENRDWLTQAVSEIQDQSPRIIHAKIARDGSRFALWVVQCDSAPHAVADPVRLPLSGDWNIQVVMDSDDDAWARARVPAPAQPQRVSGDWIARQGLPVPSLLVGQAVLIEGVRL